MMLVLTSLLFPFLPALLPTLFGAALSDADTQTDDSEDDDEFADAVEYQPQSTGLQVSDEIRKFWEERSVNPFPCLTKHYKFPSSNGNDNNNDDDVSFSSSTSSMNVELGSDSDASSIASSPSTKNNRVSAPSTDNAAAAAADRRAYVSSFHSKGLSFDSTGSTIVTGDFAAELPVDIDARDLIGAAPIPAVWMEHDGVIYRNGHARGVTTAVQNRDMRDLRDLNKTIAADMAGIVEVFEAQEQASVASLEAEHAADLAQADAFVAAAREQNRGALADQQKKHEAVVTSLRAEHKGTVSILLTQHRAELAVVKTQCQKDIASVKAQCEADVAAVETQCELEVTSVEAQLESEAAVIMTHCQQEVASIEAQYQKEVSSIKADHASDVASIHSQHVSEIASIKSDHQSEIDSIKSDHQSEIDSIKSQHISEKESVQLQRESEIASIQLQHESQLDFIQSHHASEIASSQSRHESEIASIWHYYESALDSLEAEAIAAIDSLDEAHSSLKSHHESEIASRKSRHESEIASILHSHGSALDSLNAEAIAANEAYSSLKLHHESEIASSNSRHESEIASIVHSHESALDNLNAEVTAAIDSLDEACSSLKADGEPAVILPKTVVQQQAHIALIKSTYEAHIRSLREGYLTALNDLRVELTTAIASLEKKFRSTISSRFAGRNQPAKVEPIDSELTRTNSEAETRQSLQDNITATLADARAVVLTSFETAQRYSGPAASHRQNNSESSSCDSEATTLENSLIRIDPSIRQEFFASRPANRVAHQQEQALAIVGPPSHAANALDEEGDTDSESDACTVVHRPDCADDQLTNNLAETSDDFAERLEEWLRGEQSRDMIPQAGAFPDDRDHHPRSPQRGFIIGEVEESDVHVADHQYPETCPAAVGLGITFEDNSDNHSESSYGSPKSWYENDSQADQEPWRPTSSMRNAGFPPEVEEESSCIDVEEEDNFIQAPIPIYAPIPIRPVNEKVSKYDQRMQEKIEEQSQQQKANDRQQQEQKESYAHIHAPKPIRATVFHGHVAKLEAMVAQQEADEVLHEQKHNILYSPTAVRITDFHPQQQEEEGSDFSDGQSSDGSFYGPTTTHMIDVQARSQGLLTMMQQHEQLGLNLQKGDATPPVEETASKTAPQAPALESPFEYYNDSQCENRSCGSVTPSIHTVAEELADALEKVTKDNNALQADNESLRLDYESLSVDNETLQFNVDSLEADNQTLEADNQSLQAHIAVLEATNAHNSAAFAEAAATAEHNERGWREAAAALAAAAERNNSQVFAAPNDDEATTSLLRQQEELTQALEDELEAGDREREAQAAALAAARRHGKAADDRIAALETQLKETVLARMRDEGLEWSNRKQAGHVRALLAAQIPAENERIRLHNKNVALRKMMEGVERNAEEAREYAAAVLDGTFEVVERMRTAGVANVERLAELTNDEVVDGLARYLREFMDAANGNIVAARKLLATNAELVEAAAEAREKIAKLEDEVVAAKDSCTDANNKLDDAIIAEEVAVACANRAESEVAELREKAELVPILEETVKELEDALLDTRVEAAPEAYKEIMEDLRTELHARQTGIDALITRVRAAEETLNTHSKCEQYFHDLQDQTEAHRGLITVLYKRNHELAVEMVQIRKAAGLPAKNYVVDGGCGHDAYGKLKMRVMLQKIGEVHKYELIEEDFEFCDNLDELMMQPADVDQHLPLDRPYTAVEGLIDRFFGTALDFCGIALGTGKTPDEIKQIANYLKLRATVPGDDEPLVWATDAEVQGKALVVYAGHQAQQNDEDLDARYAEWQAKEDERIWEEEAF
ncbi:putative zip1 protein [Diplodia seriata]|uniref:Putative zip1 protein n=1 Tax=Diplodia seriata TaxID=420778 RepID=A0A0G2G7N4_9PEZI|nr:putative zip1 protein [Diplodia seriata]